MPERLIRAGRVQADDFTTFDPPEGADLATVPLPAGPLIVPFALWAVRRDALLARDAPVGVQREPTADPAGLAQDLSRLAVVAIRFPKFTDGRGYSTAWLLRRRLGFAGEVRAVGDVKRDQLFYLARSGFDAFLLADGQDARAALASLSDFSAAYQAAADARPPRFRTAALLTGPAIIHG